MNLYKAVRNYILKIVAQAGSGMKVLLIDEETLNILSVVMSMSEIMQHEVYLIEKIFVSREPIKHLKCICFLRPSKSNISFLCRELNNPNYSIYYIYFTNALPKPALKLLAEADVHEVVSDVQEFYADFVALSPFLFVFDIPNSLNTQLKIRSEILSSCTAGLFSVLLAIRCCPIIRYQSSSEACCNLAESLKSTISRESIIFDFRQTDYPTLLILDRRQDPVSPLLIPWTYEAMVHELIGISHNRVNLTRGSSVCDGVKEIILSREFDEFYTSNQFSSFGEIGSAIKKLVETYQVASQQVDAKSVESIQDLKNFLENYPSFRKTSGTVETHVTLVSELSRIVKEHALLEVSEAEQELVCQDNHSTSLNQIHSLLIDPRVRLSDVLRLLMLYALKYENNTSELNMLIKTAAKKGVNSGDLQLITKLLNYADLRKRNDNFDLFSSGRKAISGDKEASRLATNAMASLTKRLFKGIKGVENVYTQHKPLLAEIINELIKGCLQEANYPVLPLSNLTSTQIASFIQRPQEIIVFIIGGATYEEALVVHKLNSLTPGINIILGSTTMHNSKSFMNEIFDSSYENKLSTDISKHSETLANLEMPRQSTLPGRFGSAVKYHLLR